MVDKPTWNHGKYFLTFVFASIFLISLGAISYDVFAMGPGPGSCTNEYSAYITNATITAGNQYYYPLKNNVYFQMLSNQTFNLAVTVNVANQSNQGNTQPGQIWIGTNEIGYPSSSCSGTVYPNQNLTFGSSVGFPATYNPGTNVNYTYSWSTGHGINFVVYWKTANPQPSVPHLQAFSGNGQVSLSWTASSSNGGSPVTNYQIWKATDSALYDATLFTTVGNVTSYADYNVTNGQTYYYEVVAENSAGRTSYFSNQASATPAAPIVPNAPITLRATPGNAQISVSWSTPSSNGGPTITSYNIYRGTSSGSETLLVSGSNSTDPYTDTTVSNGVTYFYKVTAVNSVGESSPSNEASAMPFTSSGPVVDTIPVSGVHGVAVNFNTNKVYVANGNGYSIQVIDGATNKITANITTSSDTSGNGGCVTSFVAINSHTNLIYADNQGCTHWSYGGPGWSSQTVVVINGTTNNVIASVPISHGSDSPDPIAVNPITNKVYALANAEWEVVVTNGTNQIATNISLPGQASDIAVNPQTNTIYVLDGNMIQVIDGTTDSIVKNFSWGKSSAEGIGVNPTTNTIYVSNSDYSISIIDGRTDQLITSIPSDTYGFVSVNSITNRIYVSDAGGGNYVTVLDGSTNTIISTVQVGQNPYGIGINPNANKIYVGNSGSSTVSVIDGSFSSTSTAPSAPQNLVAKAGISQISLSWTAPSSNGGSAITGYNIYRSMTSGGEGTTPVGTVSGLTLTYTDTGLTNGQTYYYEITAVNSGIQSAPSNEASAMPIAAPYPPQNLQGFSGNSQVSLSWSAPSNNSGSPITNYNVYRGLESGKESLLAKIGNVTSYNDTDFSIGSGGPYFYKVTALNSAGESLPSNEASVTQSTSATVPDAPSSLTATVKSSSQINLNWTAPSNNGGSVIIGYTIQRSTDNGNTWSTVQSNTGSTTTTYNDTGLVPSTTYSYRVSAINQAGNGSPSNTASATTSSVTPPPPTGIVLNNIQSTSGTVSSSNQITLANFNTGTGNNKLLVVGISANNNNAISVTFGGVSMTQAAGSFYNNDVEFWYLKNPTGTGNVVVTMGGPTQAIVGAYSFTGVNQTTPIPTHVTKHNTTPNSPNITITANFANDWVLDLPSIYGGSTLGFSTCAQQWDVNVPDAITGASSSKIVPTPGAVTCKWTASSGDFWDDAAIEINASK